MREMAENEILSEITFTTERIIGVAGERVRRVLADAHDGEIVLLHDMENNQATVDALREIIPALKEEGYELVNIRELFEKCGVVPVPGKTWSGAFDIRPDDF